ncbi:hypothetical protein PMZ80_009840 [Knufia obscura]|uniref:Uncharacterized protein n=2 Tax=Knufia TaxID=430999 RepID=A0AAN8EU65_9EURO|nr:hypothetical protein PMZ80_009840 [Knufia obscura]KAK5955935.1 hypothetical protein OHC33_002508 [Knufia fluminis]
MNMDILLSAVGHGHSAYDNPGPSHSLYNNSGTSHSAYDNPSQSYHNPSSSHYNNDSSASQYHQGQDQLQYQDAANVNDQEPEEELPTDAPAPPPSANEHPHELWTKTPRPRGRQAKDPHAEYVRFDCKDVDDLETNLAEYLSAPTAPAEHATIEFHFPVTAAFMVYTRDFKRDATTAWTAADVPDLMRRTAVSVVEVLQETANPKDQIVRQKAVARTIVEAVQRADGFRYSFHNNWMSREDRAHRFSFFCNDSTLNKGRAANGGAGSEGRERRKPVYDCKGLVAIKFSITKNNLEVHYRHIPLHKTFEERAPPPRRESKRRRLLEVLDPKAIERLPKKQKKDITPKQKQKLTKFGPHKKNGRPRSTNSQPRPANFGANAHRQQPTDEGLQPLIDFLGSAERETPMRGMSAPNQGADSGDDDNEGGIIMVEDDDAPAEDDDTADRTTNPPSAFPREKVRELQTRQTSQKRPKLHGPLLPGQMEGSLQAGNITWGTDTPTRHYAKQTEKERKEKEKADKKKQKEQEKASKKGKKKSQTLAGLDTAASGPLSELELLKQQLAATTERLERLEKEKSQPQPYPPYPPYQYPHYPYPPPAQGYYPPPPQSQPPPPPQPSYTVSRQAGSFHYYQPPAPAGPPMYPGGPPHPNTNVQPSAPKTPAAQQATQTTSSLGQQDRGGQASQQPPITAQSQNHATVPTTDPHGDDAQVAQSVAEKDDDDGVTADPPVRAGSAPAASTETVAEPDGSAAASSDASRPQDQTSAAAATAQPPQPARPASAPGQAASQASAAQPSPKDAPLQRVHAPTCSAPRPGQPTMGVLKVANAADKPTFHVHTNTPSSSKSRPQQPLGGVLKLVDVPNTPTARKDFQQSEDARMKGFFDSALAAMSTPTSAGPSLANRNQPPAWNGPAYAPGYGPGWQAYQGNRPPTTGQPYSYAPPPQNYPYPYPYPPPYPYSSAYGPPPPPPPPAGGQVQGKWVTTSHPQQKPAAPLAKPGERPPPGYDDLRAQMVAHAQATPTPAAKVKGKAPDAVENKERIVSSTTNTADGSTGTAQAKLAIASDLQVDTDAAASGAEEGRVDPQAQPRSAVTVSSDGSSNESVETAPEQADKGEAAVAQESDDVSDTSEET